MMSRCGDAGGRTKAGDPCQSHLNLSTVNGLCLLHDPLRKERVDAMRTAAGKATVVSKRLAKAALPADVPKAPKTLQDALQISSWITRAVLIGEIDTRVAEASVKAIRQFQLVYEKRVLQQQIEELQAQLTAAKKASGARK